MNTRWQQKLGNDTIQAEKNNLFYKCGLQKIIFALLALLALLVISSIGILAFRISFMHKFAV